MYDPGEFRGIFQVDPRTTAHVAGARTAEVEMPKKGGGKKSGGTLSLDLRDLDDDFAPKKAKRGWVKEDEPKSKGLGRSAALGRRSAALLDDDDWGSSGRKKRGGGARKPKKKDGTMILQAMDDLDPPRKKARGEGWGAGGKGHELLEDDDLLEPVSTKKKSRLAGSKRSSALPLDDEAEVVGGFHDWEEAKPKRAAAGKAKGSPARLIIKEPRKEERVFELNLKQRSFIVGREIGCDVVLSDIKASRQHMEIVYLAGKFTVKDMGSGNGTKLNGEKVTSAELGDGDVITVGGTTITFRLDEDALGRKGPEPKAEEVDGDEDDDDEVEVVLSPVAVGLVALTLVAILVLVVSFVAWLIFKPSHKKPGGSKVVELEEIPQEDPSVREAVESTARKLLERAEAANRTGKLWKALRYATVARLLNPGLKGARTLSRQIERSLTSKDGEACSVEVSPKNPVRRRKMTVRVALNGPVDRVRGTFMGEDLQFEPAGRVPGEWVASLKVPKGKRGPQPLEIRIVDLVDNDLELRRDVPVR